MPPHSTMSGLIDLIHLLESRLTTGSAVDSELDALIPNGKSYILMLFDGLGAHQLAHPNASSLSASRRTDLEAPFPTTTTVSLSTVATGSHPAAHGVLGHLMWLPEFDRVVNTLKWVDLTGKHVEHDTSTFLPAPNFWERLRSGGVEPVTVQPGTYGDTPLTKMLYRGCRFEGVWTTEELISATLDLATVPGRLIFSYLPQVDVAAHVHGQRSSEYARAIATADTVWSTIARRRQSDVALLGTADHGHVDYEADDKIIVRNPDFSELRCWGDTRVVFVSGPMQTIRSLGDATNAHLVLGDELRRLWRPSNGVHPDFAARLPDAALFAPPGRVVIPKGFDKRLVGYHGGLTRPEIEVPLMIG